MYKRQGVKNYQIPIPLTNAVGANNWWSAKRIKWVVDEYGASASELDWNYGGSFSSMAHADFAFRNRDLNAFSARLAGFAFNYGEAFGRSSALLSDGAAATYEYLTSIETRDDIGLATGKGGDWAYEAWARGGNVIKLNHEWFGTTPLLRDKFHMSTSHLGTTKWYQWNELLYLIDSTDPAAQGWAVAFDFEDRAGMFEWVLADGFVIMDS